MSLPSCRPAAGHIEQIEKLQIIKCRVTADVHLYSGLFPGPKAYSYSPDRLSLDCKLCSSEMMGYKELSLLGCHELTSLQLQSIHLIWLVFGTLWENKGIELFKDLEVLVGGTENVIIKLLCKDLSK